MKRRSIMKISKDAAWLMPGLEIKRWFALIFFGSVLITLGILTMSNPSSVYDFLIYIKSKASADVIAIITIVVGIVLFFKGWQKTNLFATNTVLKPLIFFSITLLK